MTFYQKLVCKRSCVYAVCIYQFSTLSLMWHAYRQAQADTDRDSNGYVIEPQAAGGYRYRAKNQSPLCEEEAAKKEAC